MKPALLAEIKRYNEIRREQQNEWKQWLKIVKIDVFHDNGYEGANYCFYDENNVLQFNSELIDHVIKLFQQAKQQIFGLNELLINCYHQLIKSDNDAKNKILWMCGLIVELVI